MIVAIASSCLYAFFATYRDDVDYKTFMSYLWSRMDDGGHWNKSHDFTESEIKTYNNI